MAVCAAKKIGIVAHFYMDPQANSGGNGALLRFLVFLLLDCCMILHRASPLVQTFRHPRSQANA